jgi:Trypsin-like peptidase domain
MVFRKIIPTEYFPNLGIWILEEGLALPDGEDLNELRQLEAQELVKIINWRFNSDRKSAITAVFGDPDFLPFSFLERGIRSGAAVCRLMRNISDVDKLYERVVRAEQERSKNFTDVELTEIFNVKDASFFEDHLDRPSNALGEGRLKQLMPIPIGTGFLVGRSHLLTNHHILKDESFVSEFTIELGYDQDFLGRNIEPIRYGLDSSFFQTSEGLDYTLVKVKPNPLDDNLMGLGQAGDTFGWLQMVEDYRAIAPPLNMEQATERGITSELNSKVKERLVRLDLDGKSPGLAGEPVNIIQHPKGKRKEITLSSNRVQKIFKDFIQYEADADFSSSGSPVLNQQWQLVGLHHAAVAQETEENGLKKLQIAGQQGVRICQIVKDLRDKAALLNQTAADGVQQKPLLKDAESISRFLDDFVAQYQESSDKLKQPKESSPLDSAHYSVYQSL